MNIDKILTAGVFIIVYYVLFYIGKLINDLLHSEYNLNKELVEEDNPAVALMIAGYYFGLILSIGGTLVGPSHGLIEDLIDMCIYGVMSIVLLNVSWFICDRIILYKFNMSEELLRDRNQGTGVVSFAVSVASGAVIYGSVSGEGGNVFTATAFWGAGQLLLIVAVFVYNLITPYDVHDEIEKDNVAAGVSLAGALIAMGIIVGLSAEGDFSSWSVDFIGFLSRAAIGLALLPIIRFLTDKVLLPTVKLSDEIANQAKPNVGAAYIEALSYISAAFIVNWCV